jgi:acetyl-CoA acetyltransferase family protein
MLAFAARPNTPRLVLAAGIRTPFVKAGGAFAREDAAHLGALVARELLARTGVDPAALSEVIAGCVGPPFTQANVGRVIALRAGVPRAVPARTVARNCASGFEAVTSAAANLLAGVGDLYLCVGVEHMSGYPLAYNEEATKFFSGMMKAKSAGHRLGALLKFRPRMLQPRVTLLEGLTDPTTGLIMGRTAEVLARDWNLTREECDRFALESHRRVKLSRDSGRLAQEILPVLPLGARDGAAAVQHDDGVRDDQTLAALAKLKPFFEKPDGIVTVGSSSQVTDGAVALLVCTEARAHGLGLRPLAAIRAFAWAGLDPARMGLGPVHASAAALAAAGLELARMGVVEINEAFAAQVLACERALASEKFAREQLGRTHAVGTLDPARTNPNGGAIALGHPVGASGARLLLTLALEMRARQSELGLATLCIGGGQGGAIILEAVA